MARISAYETIPQSEISADDLLLIETVAHGTKTLKATELLNTYTRTYIDTLQRNLELSIDDLGDRLTSLSNRIDTDLLSRQDVEGIVDTAIDGLNTRFSSIEHDVSENADDISALGADVSNLEIAKVPSSRKISDHITLSQDVTSLRLSGDLKSYIVIYGGTDKPDTETQLSYEEAIRIASCNFYVNRSNGRMWAPISGPNGGGDNFTVGWLEIQSRSAEYTTLANAITALQNGKVDDTRSIAGYTLSSDISEAALASKMAPIIIQYGNNDKTSPEYYIAPSVAAGMVRDMLYINTTNGKMWRLQSIEVVHGEGTAIWQYIARTDMFDGKTIAYAPLIYPISAENLAHNLLNTMPSSDASGFIWFTTSDKPATETLALGRLAYPKGSLAINTNNGNWFRCTDVVDSNGNHIPNILIRNSPSSEAYADFQIGGPVTYYWELVMTAEDSVIYTDINDSKVPRKSYTPIPVGTYCFTNYQSSSSVNEVRKIYRLTKCALSEGVYNLDWNLEDKVVELYNINGSEAPLPGTTSALSWTYYPKGTIFIHGSYNNGNNRKMSIVVGVTETYSTSVLYPTYTYEYLPIITLDNVLGAGGQGPTLQIYDTEAVNEQLNVISQQLDRRCYFEYGAVNVTHPEYYTDDSNHTMIGTYQVTGNLCTVTAVAKSVNGWSNVSYRLPYEPLSNAQVLVRGIAGQVMYAFTSVVNDQNVITLQPSTGGTFSGDFDMYVTITYRMDDEGSSRTVYTQAELDLACANAVSDREEEIATVLATI